MALLENVRKTPVAIQAITTGSAMLLASSGILSIGEAFLLIIASAETLNVGIDYLAKEMK